MTEGLEIPETGLSLRPGPSSETSAAKPAQIMRLNLAQHTLDDLIGHLLRNDNSARVRLGKHPSIHWGGKSQHFHAYPETHRAEIYQSSSDKHNIYFTGALSHSLEVERAKEDMAASDQALANLEESLQAFEKGKESKVPAMIRHPDEYKAIKTAGGGKNTPDLNRGLLRPAANRSLTASPPPGAAKSPAGLIPTSAPASQTKNNARLEALKTPFIHLLAVRAVSAKFLARQTRSSIEDCTSSPKSTELRTASTDRQQAIENAISAFDRMRISRSDKLWQLLLPKEERGKGKCLSRLNLGNGPIKKTATPRGPDGADDRKDEDVDRASGSSMTQKADTATHKARPDKPANKQPASKQSAKAKNTANSTLTGRVTKKTAGKKVPAKVDTSKFKSSEFVHSSDEESDIPEASPPSPPAARPPAQNKPSVKKAPAPKNLPDKAQVPAKRPAEAPATTTSSSKVPRVDAPNLKLESTKAAASKKPASRPSTSPQKPSPLSSPPTNASDDGPGRARSDSQNHSSSSSSSSPLMSQLRAQKASAATAPSVRKQTAQTNGVSKPAAAANPLKRKAEPERPPAPAARTTGNLDHKRRRAVSTSSGGSTGSASPPLSEELARQKLREKSQDFKRKYQKYLNFHRKLEAQAHPGKADLELLQKQHDRLEVLKQEIWDEDRRLRREAHH
ncbi:hypothetical protein N7468_010038 [Penicillium chermesinum]|uniref:E3 ubiquitin-protein ligase n=1 Tax=Penicillium chermesinum TaxID=63820 RepID=A0A9W9NBX8_9EURO|nr:uncharacterized protein N7468_010038 [Penicillium chermesinum]KAJ5217030.1 hypothetical protein N7468_010038 [Penicillium chermesinum]